MEVNHTLPTDILIPENHPLIHHVRSYKNAQVSIEAYTDEGVRLEFDTMSYKRHDLKEEEYDWLGYTQHIWVNGKYQQLNNYVHVWRRKIFGGDS